VSWFLSGSLFRAVAIVGFEVTVVAIVIHFVVSGRKLDKVPDKEQSPRIEQKPGVIGVIRKLVFLLALICFIVLLVTGFVPMFVFGRFISGWWLFAHAIAAPVFAACIAILAVLWADKNRLDKNYWPWLNKVLRRQPKSTALRQKYELKLRICFWVILVLSLPVIGSETLSMFPFFGTDGQVLLLQLHRYSALLLSLFAIVYLYLTVRRTDYG